MVTLVTHSVWLHWAPMTMVVIWSAKTSVRLWLHSFITYARISFRHLDAVQQFLRVYDIVGGYIVCVTKSMNWLSHRAVSIIRSRYCVWSSRHLKPLLYKRFLRVMVSSHYSSLFRSQNRLKKVSRWKKTTKYVHRDSTITQGNGTNELWYNIPCHLLQGNNTRKIEYITVVGHEQAWWCSGGVHHLFSEASTWVQANALPLAQTQDFEKNRT